MLTHSNISYWNRRAERREAREKDTRDQKKEGVRVRMEGEDREGKREEKKIEETHLFSMRGYRLGSIGTFRR